MSTTSADASGIYFRKPVVGLVLVLLGWLWCLGHVYPQRHHRQMRIDFRAVYGSSRCLIAGCNPYYFEDIRAQFLAHGGSLAEAGNVVYGPFMPSYVGYPPSTLFYLVPFVFPPWPIALVIYLAIASTFYAVGALLFADLCSEYIPIASAACLALFLAWQDDIVFYGQPTLLAAALLCIGVWSLLKNRYPRLGVLSFAFSLVFKPPLGGLFLLYFLAAAQHRKRAWQVIGVAVVLLLPVLLWFSMHSATQNWVHDLKANVAGISAPGNLSDPGPQNALDNRIIDLQAIVSRYRDVPSFYNHVVWGLSALVIAVWLYPVIRRRPSQEKDILSLAAIAAFSMLPVYHRVYDSRALLILFPALAVLMRRTVWWGRAATVLTLFVSFVLSDAYTVRSKIDSHHVAQSLAGQPVLQTMAVHLAPLALLLVTIFYLAVLYVCPPSLALNAEALSQANCNKRRSIGWGKLHSEFDTRFPGLPKKFFQVETSASCHAEA